MNIAEQNIPAEAAKSTALAEFHVTSSSDILYERLPVWQEIYDFGVRDPVAVLYPAYDADHNPGLHFIEKPFTKNELATKVRLALEN